MCSRLTVNFLTHILYKISLLASTIEIEHIQRWYEENPDKDENIESLSLDAKKSDEIIT